MRFAWLMILAACGGATPGAGPAEPPPIDDEPLSLGTASAESSIPCPTGAAPGARCTSLVVACPRLDALPVVVVTSAPSGATPTATVLLHNYVGGTELLDDGFVAAYGAAKIGVVQVQWKSDWPASDHGVKHAACRYATLVRWVFETVHASDRTRGFCAQSFGGGAGGLAFALTHYGMGDVLDAVTVSGGPPFARIDLGCDARSPPRVVCPAASAVPVAYSGGPLAAIAGWEVAPSCGKNSASPAEVARWQADSVLSSGAQLAFGKTSVAAWYCAGDPDPTIGQGSMFMDAITTDKAVHCVDGVSVGATKCVGKPWPSALPAIVGDMRARCVPRHAP